jgi:citrate synthase
MMTMESIGPDDSLLSNEQAAKLLAVKPATLYAYVSRGLIRSIRAQGDSRSAFLRSEIELLAQRRGQRGGIAAGGTGRAVNQTEPSAIVDDRLYYRDEDACELASVASFEAVAEWLWIGEQRPAEAEVEPWVASERALTVAGAVQALLPPDALPLDRLAVLVPVLGANDPFRLDLTPRAVLLSARALIATLVDALPLLGPVTSSTALAARLWSRLTVEPPSDSLVGVLNAALVLLTDHGARPPATATARLAASLRSDPYAVVTAAMGVGSGAQQARPFLTLQSMFRRVDDPEGGLRVLSERIQQDGDVPGFQPRQYQSADPRARLLLTLLAERAGGSGRLAGILRIVEIMHERRGAEPSVEVAVAALAALADMCPGAGEAIFRVARTAGWIAHAIQIYAQSPRTDLPSLLNS